MNIVQINLKKKANQLLKLNYNGYEISLAHHLISLSLK